MYSNEKSVQITLSLLKSYQISHVVLSPGGSDAPIVKSFEDDGNFHCYSVVDERSSVFFAIGLSQELKEPVVCVCTAGTAVSNFLTGITEAYYQNVPIVAITSDSHAYNLDQLVLQKLDQLNIFKGVIRSEVTLPAVKDSSDEHQCNMLVNEALLALNHHGSGPVHINIPITLTLACTTETLPVQRVINRCSVYDTDYSQLAKKLKNKKVLVIVGQDTNVEPEEVDLFNRFFERYNCAFNIETLSNIRCKGSVVTYSATETLKAHGHSELVPDIIISMGNFVASYMLTPFLRSYNKGTDNWLIHESGAVRDPYWNLTTIIEGTPIEFLKRILEKNVESTLSHSYYENWKSLTESIIMPELGFSSMSIARILSKKLPDSAVLHTAILNSTRLMQFFPPQNQVTCYSNLGALGIDGCTATAVGHSMASDKLTYLLTGDLSFFYGMNAVSIRGIKNNLRIILFNNGGGEEFKIKLNLPKLDKYVCARSSHRTAKGWVESLNFGYYTATNNEEVSLVLDEFAKPSEKPLLLELFIDMEKDAEVIRNTFAMNKPEPSKIEKLKTLITTSLPEPIVNHLKRVLQK